MTTTSKPQRVGNSIRATITKEAADSLDLKHGLRLAVKHWEAETLLLSVAARPPRQPAARS